MSKTNSIKIAAFEVRDDEKAFFKTLSQELNIELSYSKQSLNNQTIDLCKGAEAITTLGRSILEEPILQQLKDMGIKAVATRTVGYNHIDIKAATRMGIRVSNANYAPNGVADYTVMLMLMLLRKYKQAMFRANVNDYSLPGLRGREMKDLTIGIVGTGSIGEQVIKNLSGFGCRIFAHNRTPKKELKDIAHYTSIDELYQQSDIISYHLPLNESTRQMVNSNAINKMKKGVLLINSSRGELMNIPDIINAIEHQKIGGLALDVFEKESGIYHVDRRNDIISNRDMAYVRQFPNVIMTQHIAFYTDAAVQSMVSCAIHSIVSDIKTGHCKNALN